jgi:hypothetical protein
MSISVKSESAKKNIYLKITAEKQIGYKESLIMKHQKGENI